MSHRISGLEGFGEDSMLDNNGNKLIDFGN